MTLLVRSETGRRPSRAFRPPTSLSRTMRRSTGRSLTAACLPSPANPGPAPWRNWIGWSSDLTAAPLPTSCRNAAGSILALIYLLAHGLPDGETILAKRSEERRVGKECVSRVDIGGGR